MFRRALTGLLVLFSFDFRRAVVGLRVFSLTFCQPSFSFSLLVFVVLLPALFFVFPFGNARLLPTFSFSLFLVFAALRVLCLEVLLLRMLVLRPLEVLLLRMLWLCPLQVSLLRVLWLRLIYVSLLRVLQV